MDSNEIMTEWDTSKTRTLRRLLPGPAEGAASWLPLYKETCVVWRSPPAPEHHCGLISDPHHDILDPLWDKGPLRPMNNVRLTSNRISKFHRRNTISSYHQYQCPFALGQPQPPAARAPNLPLSIHPHRKPALGLAAVFIVLWLIAVANALELKEVLRIGAGAAVTACASSIPSLRKADNIPLGYLAATYAFWAVGFVAIAVMTWMDRRERTSTTPNTNPATVTTTTSTTSGDARSATDTKAGTGPRRRAFACIVACVAYCLQYSLARGDSLSTTEGLTIWGPISLCLSLYMVPVFFDSSVPSPGDDGGDSVTAAQQVLFSVMNAA